jgi:hypothetical protein
MIDREEFSKALEEIRHLRALLAAERFLHDRLRRSVEAQAHHTAWAAERRGVLRRAS